MQFFTSMPLDALSTMIDRELHPSSGGSSAPIPIGEAAAAGGGGGDVAVVLAAAEEENHHVQSSMNPPREHNNMKKKMREMDGGTLAVEIDHLLEEYTGTSGDDDAIHNQFHVNRIRRNPSATTPRPTWWTCFRRALFLLNCCPFLFGDRCEFD